MTEETENRILVGVIGKPRGNRGEVYVEPCTDFPELRFRAPGTLLLEPAPAGSGIRPVELVESRWLSHRLALRFRGVETISAAEEFRGGRLYAEGPAPELEQGSFLHHQLTGLAVVDEDGRRLGEISGLLRTAGGDILEVRPPDEDGGEPFLIPAVEEFCYDVDLSGGVVRVRLPEGLLEINR